MSADVAMHSDNDGREQTSAMNGHAVSMDQDCDMSDDVPLSQSTRKDATSSPPQNLKRKKPIYGDSSSSDDDIPLASSPGKPSRVNGINHDESGSEGAPDSEEALKVRKTTANGRTRPPRKKVKEESDGSDDDQPLKSVSEGGPDSEGAPKVRTTANGRTRPPRKKVKEESDGSDDDQPLKTPQKRRAVASRKRKVKARDSDAEDDADASPKNAPVSKGRHKRAKEETSSAETPKPKKGKGKKIIVKEEDVKSPVKGKGKKKEKKEEDEEEVFRWWENAEQGDGSVKWNTLEHNGVFFPPPYEPLPEHIKMMYKGRSVDLPPDAEEVAGFYAALLETDHAKDATFNKNFFDDWKIVLKKHPPRDGTKITSYEHCDFRPMYEYFEAEKAKKKTMTTEEKKAAKKAKEEAEAQFTTCLLNGRKEKVGNFRVEPPGLFRGRGDHPKKGALKLRVRPEDITINIGKDAPIPIPNMPGTWKAVQHDNTVTWLATWTENINGNHKYVFLAAGSMWKGQSDMQKFEKARELKNYVDRIRQNYQADLRSKVMADRQRATAMYFIDKLALRAGNEKGEDEADTVGCCSLRCEHVTLEAPDFVVFDFLGKDSIRYFNKVQVEPQVFKNIRIFKDNKNDDDNLFDRVTTTSLNKHLNNEMKGLTAKVFRTFNASITFQQLLDEGDLKNASLQEKLYAYNNANRRVAILCNHQRAVPKTHEQSMGKMRYKQRALKYDRMKLRHVLFKIDPKYKKNSKYKEDESDIDDDWIGEHEENLKKKEIEKVEKKFAKENEKLQEEGEKIQKDSVLKERIVDIEEEFDQLAKERGTGQASLKRERPVEKIEESIDKLTDKINSFKLQMVDRDAGKEVALGTSKINYLDPRITAAWCQIHDVPIEKIFSKTLVTKFPWAMEVNSEWKF